MEHLALWMRSMAEAHQAKKNRGVGSPRRLMLDSVDRLSDHPPGSPAARPYTTVPKAQMAGSVWRSFCWQVSFTLILEVIDSS